MDEQKDSDRLDELAELLSRLDKRRNLSVEQVIVLFFLAALLIFVTGTIGIVILGPYGSIFASVFTSLFLLFSYEGMRSANVRKRTGFEKASAETEEEQQEHLDKFDDGERKT